MSGQTCGQLGVPALFVETRGVYARLGCDVYGIERDARTFPGGAASITHPPCRLWSSLRHLSKAHPSEKEVAFFALDVVRRWGGVLEHPLRSSFWREAGVRDLHSGRRDKFGGWLLPIFQQWFGHRAQKATFLYLVGVEPSALPPIPLVLGDATHTVGLWSGRDRSRCRPTISNGEYARTPEPLARWLIQVVGSVR